MMEGKDYGTCPFSSGNLLLFVFSPSNHILKNQFISQTKHGFRDSGLGIEEKERGLEPQKAVNMALTCFDALWLIPSQSWE